MRILFGSGIDGFCHRYAVLHWAEQLATQGIASTVRAHSDPRLAADLATHDLLVLYRVPWSAWIEHLLARARARGRAVAFAVDDLIIAPGIDDAPPTRQMASAERRLWDDGVQRYRRTLLACDAALVTTGPLVEAVRGAGKSTFLHRAGLAGHELALGAAARNARDTAADSARRVRLGYFAGTPTHDDDFAVITRVLAAIMERMLTVELVIGGPLILDASLARFRDRITRLPLVPWPELPALIARADVNLVPLEWQHPFVAAKGAIKYLEAAAVGVPTVASPSEAFRHAIRPGENGLLASDAAEWHRALETLVGNAERRARLGAAAWGDVRARFAPDVQGRALAAICAQLVHGHERPRADDGEEESLDEVALARAFHGETARRAREPLGLPGYAITGLGGTTPPLGDGVELRQSFRATGDGLTRIDVHTVTYGLPLDHLLVAHVRREDGTTVATRTIPAALAPDRDWLAIEFPPEPSSEGHRYVLVLEARGTGPRNALSFGCTERLDETGPYTLAGKKSDGSLVIRTFMTETRETSGGRELRCRASS